MKVQTLLIKASILSITLFTSATSSASFESWSQYNLFSLGAQIGNQYITRYDVVDHIHNVILSDRQKVALFNQFDKNYDDYFNHIVHLTFADGGHLYNSALRDLVYTEMIQKDAIEYQNAPLVSVRSTSFIERLFGGGNEKIDIHPSNGRRNIAFNITQTRYQEDIERRFENQLQNFEEQAQEERKTPSEVFASRLVEMGYPHQEHESKEDVLTSWKEALERQVMKEYLQREVQRWENYQATKYDPNLHIITPKMIDFYNQSVRIIQNELLSSPLSLEDFQRFQENNAHHLIVTTSLDVSSPAITPFNEIRDDHEKLEIINSFKHEMNSLVEESLSYETRIDVLIQRYNSSEELEQLAREYDLKPSNSELMLSRLYQMASIIKQENLSNTERDEIRHQTREAFTIALNEIINHIEDYLNEIVSSQSIEDDRFFHQIISQEFSSQRRRIVENLSNELTSETRQYLNATLRMSEFLLRTKAQNLSNSQPITVSATFCEFVSYECQNPIERHLKTVKYQEHLENYQQNQLSRNFQNRIRLTKADGTEISGAEAVNFVLNQ